MKNDKSISAPLDWLLEPGDIGVKYLAMRDLLKSGDKEIRPVKKAAHENGPIAEVLAKMHEEGWERPAGYYPGTRAQIDEIPLALGASPAIDGASQSLLLRAT
jgi:hypothetical protein